jgi:mono/diheme cytochrome c family protein
MKRLVLPAMLLALAACTDQSMTEQKRYDTFEKSSFWENGSSARPLPDHVVAEGDAARAAASATPPPISEAVVARGRERFGIFCTPCHGLAGDGDGMIVQRGFPAPPSFHETRLRAAPARHFFDVITDGYGAMYSYDSRVPPADRWAIVAYIRALQIQRHATLAMAPEAGDKLP